MTRPSDRTYLADAEIGAAAVSMTSGERHEAQELWIKLGKDEAAHPTPEQLLAFMRECPDAAGLDLAARILRWNETATRCFQADHDGLVDELRLTRAELATARRSLDAVDAWLAAPDEATR